MQARTIRRSLAAVALLFSFGVVAGPGLPAAEAHTCAQVRVHINYGTIGVPACHTPAGDPGDICVSDDETVFGYGEGETLCVHI